MTTISRSIEVSRTLVKSPPELWTELQGDRLTNALGGGSVRPLAEEQSLEWECDGARGTAILEQSGWGTKVTLRAEVEEVVRRLEPEVARLGFWSRVLGASPPPPPGPPPAPPRHEEVERALQALLDDLGSAHKKPYQAG
jgi:hypothetical protein